MPPVHYSATQLANLRNRPYCKQWNTVQINRIPRKRLHRTFKRISLARNLKPIYRMHTESKQLSKQPKGRLLALDILRGITIAGMILVNNPRFFGAKSMLPSATPSGTAHPLTDLVFPFFLCS